MTQSDDDGPAVLTSEPTEMGAAIVVAKLESEGIDAEMSGALTSGFRAETYGEVQILVRRSDLDRARELLDAWKTSES